MAMNATNEQVSERGNTLSAISKTATCVHNWIQMSPPETYPASDGYKCTKCLSIELSWLGKLINPAELLKVGEKKSAVKKVLSTAEACLTLESADQALIDEVKEFAAARGIVLTIQYRNRES